MLLLKNRFSLLKELIMCL